MKNHMRATVIVLAAALVTAPSASAQEWEQYVSTQDGFKVDFPGPPKITETTWKSEYEYALPARVYKQVGVSCAGVQLVEILRDDDAFGIRPGTRADATARVGRLVAVVGIPLGAQVDAPGFVAETDGARQLLANLIGSAQPAQIDRLAPGATDKKAHGGTDLGAFSPNALSLVAADDTERRHRREKKDMLLHKQKSALFRRSAPFQLTTAWL